MSSSLKTSPGQNIRELLQSGEVIAALDWFTREADAITREHIEICSIPASPFQETARAEYLRDKFLELDLTEVEIDAEGNTIGLLKGNSLKPLIVVSAHLDTVFPPGTDFTVRRDGDILLAPGISDDGCGLAAVVAIARAFRKNNINTAGSVLFVCTVGEEGEGNLRGVRHLFTKSRWAKRVDAFLSFDGPGIDRITNRALGSRRYRVELHGTGGHSWGDFGIPNPVHALGRAIARLAAYPAPLEPRTTFNVGRIAGGTSVNAIPTSASMEVDLRSADDAELRRIDAYFRRTLGQSVDEENGERRTGDATLDVQLKLIGERPSGETSPESMIVELAQEATSLLGREARLDQSSTDSNLPISIGIPAITLGAGGTSGSSHTLDEWYDPRDRDMSLKRGFLLILGMVGTPK
ncbi:MAG: peptidase M20 [Blastocatellia bacterium]|nr:MAG: peptidase M20 [Blastocatellia bacterium]